MQNKQTEQKQYAEDCRQLINLAIEIAQLIIECGGETYRSEECMQRICAAYHIKNAHVFSLPTGILISYSVDDDIKTVLRRPEAITYNFRMLDALNALSRDIAEHKTDIASAQKRLSHLKKHTLPNMWIQIIAMAFSIAFFAPLFGGSIFDCTIGGICGAIVQGLCVLLEREHMFSFLTSLFGGAICTVIAIASVILFKTGSISIIASSGILSLVPGIMAVNAIRDAMHSDFGASSIRFCEVLIIAVSIAAGTASILGIYMMLGGII